MKYIVYLTTNNKSEINGIKRIYIGVHQTENPEIFDGYIGCGCYNHQPSTYMYPKTPFQYAVKKYGPDAFTRSTLYIFDLKEDAYNKEAELVDTEFIKLDHTYNACLGGISYKNYKPLYQFDLEGTLKKKWDFSIEAYEFYSTPMEKFNYAIHDKHPLFDSLWSHKESIDITEYTIKPWGSPKVTYLYSKLGKFLGEFYSRKECADYLHTLESNICRSITTQGLLLDQYYVSNKLVDVFIPKPRIQLSKSAIYLYTESGEYLGEYVGKEIMKVIDLYSWSKINDIFRYKKGWYKTFYLSLEKVDQIPTRVLNNRNKVDVYDKYGNFIETLNSIKETREKYKVPAAKIKNIQLGNRYYGNYIFKYSK